MAFHLLVIVSLIALRWFVRAVVIVLLSRLLVLSDQLVVFSLNMGAIVNLQGLHEETVMSAGRLVTAFIDHWWVKRGEGSLLFIILTLQDRLHIDTLLFFPFHCIHILLFRSVCDASIRLVMVQAVLVCGAFHDLSFEHDIKLRVLSFALDHLNANPLDQDENSNDSNQEQGAMESELSLLFWLILQALFNYSV